MRALVWSSAVAALLLTAGCSSGQSEVPASVPASAPASAAAASDKVKALPRGTPFDVTAADMTIHSFNGKPTTKSGGFRMNCFPLWRAVEPTRGKYNWALFDDAIAKQKAWGAEDLLYSFCGTPEWAAGKVADPSAEVFGPGSTATPKDLSDFEEYVRQVVRRYKGTIGAYEVWNEVSSPQFFQGTPAQMADMTEIVKRVVAKEDPKAIVTSASLQTHRADYYDGFAVPYLKELRKRKWPVDVYNGHFYPAGKGGPEQRLAQIAMFRRTLARLDAARKPVWDTEVNYYTGLPGGAPDGRITGPRAVAWPVRTYLDGWRSDLRRNYWYFATQEYDDFPGIQTRPQDPSSQALATFADWTVGSRFNGCDQKGAMVRCSVVRDGQEQFIAWAESDKAGSADAMASYPLEGSAQVCELPDGACLTKKVVVLSESPVLIVPEG